MKIAVLSDTHWQPGSNLPKVINIIRDIHPDYILHAGDWTDLALLDRLNQIAPTHSVAGNCDTTATAARLGYSKIVTLGGINIGLTHGHLVPAPDTALAARHIFRNDAVKIIVFGHSHIPCNQTADGILLFNPGSAVRPLGTIKRPSCGLLTIDENHSIHSEIIYFDK